MKKEKTVGYTAVFENPEFGKIRIQTDGTHSHGYEKLGKPFHGSYK